MLQRLTTSILHHPHMDCLTVCECVCVRAFPGNRFFQRCLRSSCPQRPQPSTCEPSKVLDIIESYRSAVMQRILRCKRGKAALLCSQHIIAVIALICPYQGHSRHSRHGPYQRCAARSPSKTSGPREFVFP